MLAGAETWIGGIEALSTDEAKTETAANCAGEFNATTLAALVKVVVATLVLGTGAADGCSRAGLACWRDRNKCRNTSIASVQRMHATI